MIIGFGTDLVDIRRIEQSLAQFDTRFEQRIFTAKERANPKKNARYYAKRFAAKEACLKALGSGFRGISWHDMEITSNELGAPSLALTGGAAKQLSALTPPGKQAKIWLSLSDEYPYAQAQVIIEASD